MKSQDHSFVWIKRVKTLCRLLAGAFWSFFQAFFFQGFCWFFLDLLLCIMTFRHWSLPWVMAWYKGPDLFVAVIVQPFVTTRNNTEPHCNVQHLWKLTSKFHSPNDAFYNTSTAEWFKTWIPAITGFQAPQPESRINVIWVRKSRWHWFNFHTTTEETSHFAQAHKTT